MFGIFYLHDLYIIIFCYKNNNPPILKNLDDFPLVHFIRPPTPLQLCTKEYVTSLSTLFRKCQNFLSQS